jgi:hypothetical protein
MGIKMIRVGIAMIRRFLIASMDWLVPCLNQPVGFHVAL